MIIFTAWLAFVLDFIIGDPKSKYHPVVLIGKLISFLEKILLVPEHHTKKKICLGAILVTIVLTTVYIVTAYIVQYFTGFGPIAVAIISGILLSFTISPRSLAEAGIEIRNYLINGDIINARYKVGWIVGRDTENLETPDITRATVETIAENIVDGIISPLFYFCLGGAPLAFLYRAVNTLDSMIAYKNDKYLYFGRVAAHVDDVFNYIPAKITACLIILAAFILRLNYKQAYKIIKRDAKKHLSPNSGYSEAGVAGALDVQLGGLNYYFGIPSSRATMGDRNNILEPIHISQTIYIMYVVTILFLIFVSMILLAIGGIV